MVRFNKFVYDVFFFFLLILPKYLYSTTCSFDSKSKINGRGVFFSFSSRCYTYIMKIYHQNRQTNDELFTNATHSLFVCNVCAHGESHKINECATIGIFIFIQYLLVISIHFYSIIYLKILISIPVDKKKTNHRFAFDCKSKQREKRYGQYVFSIVMQTEVLFDKPNGNTLLIKSNAITAGADR